MKHSIEELYTVRNSGRPFLATKAYIEACKIPTAKELVHEARKFNMPYALRALSHVSFSDPVPVYHPDTLGFIYMFGEKTWFDTEEERNQYRTEYHKQKKELERRNRAKNQILQYLSTLTTEQIETLIEELDA